MTISLQSAIDAALAQNWDEAVKINRELLKKNKNDLDTLIRLAFSFTQTNELEKAKKIYKKILSLDRYNSLALKNLNKISQLAASQNNRAPSHHRVPPSVFIEEPGKTKVVQLINLAPNKILCRLNIGDTVYIHPKKHAVEIRGEMKEYYGALPDDVAFRLLKFLSVGNTYLAAVKNIQKNQLSVFIRELSRGKKLSHQPTFTPTSKKDYSASVHKDIKKAIISEEETQEQDQSEDEE